MRAFLLTAIFGLGFITHADIVGSARGTSDIILQKPTDPEPCLALIAKAIPQLIATGETLIEPSAKGLTIYSGNGRSTFVSTDGNCGPVEGPKKNGSPYDSQWVYREHIKKFELYFGYLKQQADKGAISKGDYQKVIAECRASSLPLIKVLPFDKIGADTNNSPGRPDAVR